MGWVGNAAAVVRGYFDSQPDRKSGEIARGSQTGASLLGSNHMNMLGGLVSDLQPLLELEGALQQRYIDYETMDDYPELSTALDIYADDSTQPDWVRGLSMWVKTDDDWLKATLTDLYHSTLMIEQDLWPHTRTTVKYGNAFAEILLKAGQGVVGLNYLPPPSMRRIIEPRGRSLGFVQDPNGRFNIASEAMMVMLQRGKLPSSEKGSLSDGTVLFEPWEVVHWRLRMKHMNSIYGHSVMEPARHPYRRLSLLEDAVLIYRLTRSPERFAFFVDVGALPPAEALGYVDSVKAMYKKKRFYNPSKGGMDMRYNPLSHTDDFWVPSREGRDATRIETIGGMSYTGMDDVEYFRRKLAAAIKIPAIHLGFEAEAVSQHLSHTDVRFARTILRIQREMRQGYKQVGRVHLAALGKMPKDHDWSLEMAIPTMVYELAIMEALATKNSIARDMSEQVSVMWVLTNVYKFSEKEAEDILKQRKGDVIRQAVWDAEASAEADKVSNPDGGDESVQRAWEQRREAKLRAVDAHDRSFRDLEEVVTRGSKASEKRMLDRLAELKESQSELGMKIARGEKLLLDLRREVARK